MGRVCQTCLGGIIDIIQLVSVFQVELFFDILLREVPVQPAAHLRHIRLVTISSGPTCYYGVWGEGLTSSTYVSVVTFTVAWCRRLLPSAKVFDLYGSNQSCCSFLSGDEWD